VYTRTWSPTWMSPNVNAVLARGRALVARVAVDRDGDGLAGERPVTADRDLQAAGGDRGDGAVEVVSRRAPWRGAGATARGSGSGRRRRPRRSARPWRPACRRRRCRRRRCRRSRTGRRQPGTPPNEVLLGGVDAHRLAGERSAADGDRQRQRAGVDRGHGPRDRRRRHGRRIAATLVVAAWAGRVKDRLAPRSGRRGVVGEDDDVVADRDVGERDLAVAAGVAHGEDRRRR
jgi:hypothetical protein